MGAIIKFISERGFTLMLYGMGTTVTGAIAYIYFNHIPAIYLNTPYPGIALTVTILGVTVYFTGRVSLAIQRRRAQYKTPRDPDDGDESDIRSKGGAQAASEDAMFEIKNVK